VADCNISGVEPSVFVTTFLVLPVKWYVAPVVLEKNTHTHTRVVRLPVLFFFFTSHNTCFRSNFVLVLGDSV
jgi:hypothetical protein